ncbi:MAG: FkbM family methyltransferase [Candidatus Kapaibacterium sp.]|jgi:FkbM family methyltransferase
MNVGSIEAEAATSIATKLKTPFYSPARPITHRYSDRQADPFVSLLQKRGINLILDIGAGSGHFSSELRSCGYDQRIVSFEPRRIHYTSLRKTALDDASWETVQCALGDKDGIVEIHCELASHAELAAAGGSSKTPSQSCTSMCEDVVMSRVSTLLPAFRRNDETVLVRINVPGAERMILQGSRAALQHIDAFHIHISLKNNVSGLSALEDITRVMQDLGYDCVSIQPGSIDAQSGTMLHAGVTFARMSTAS